MMVLTIFGLIIFIVSYILGTSAGYQDITACVIQLDRRMRLKEQRFSDFSVTQIQQKILALKTERGKPDIEEDSD